MAAIVFEDLAFHVYTTLSFAVLIAAAIMCLVKRKSSPRTAWMLLAAIGLRLIQTAMLCALSYGLFESSIGFLENGTGSPDFSDPQAVFYLMWEIATAVLNLASWSCIAWAVLMRPDDIPRSEPPPC